MRLTASTYYPIKLSYQRNNITAKTPAPHHYSQPQNGKRSVFFVCMCVLHAMMCQTTNYKTECVFFYSKFVKAIIHIVLTHLDNGNFIFSLYNSIDRNKKLTN